MGQPIEFRDFYRKVLSRLDMGQVAKLFLQRVVAGDDRGVDVEQSVRSDKFFTHQIINQASSALKKGEVKSLSHAAVLLGHETVRDFILGHTILRIYDNVADSRFESFSQSRTRVKRALAAESLALRSRNEYPGMALVAGFVFDAFENWILSDENLSKTFAPYVEKLWKHSYRTASIAWALATHERIQIHLKRIAMAAGLLHDVGRLVLICAYPDRYATLLPKFEESLQSEIDDELVQTKLEFEEFGFSHTEIGSLLFSKFDFLEELEGITDYHHDFSVLKSRDPQLFLLAILLNISDRLALLSDAKNNFEASDIRRIIDPHRAFFPLSAEEIQSRVVTLRGKGLFE